MSSYRKIFIKIAQLAEEGKPFDAMILIEQGLDISAVTKISAAYASVANATAYA